MKKTGARSVEVVLCGVLLAMSMSACRAQVYDCNNRTFYTSKDHAAATDSGAGTASQPFKTIQKLADVLADCVDNAPGNITGIVSTSAVPYTEIDRKSGLDFGGVTFIKGGVSDTQRIIIKGADGERPVLDQRRSKSSSGCGTGCPVTGFFIARDALGTGDSANYITIRNFEIMGATASGVFTDPDGNQNKIGIIVENNHIHHLYADDNLGGIRFDFCRDCIARNNVIHDIYETRTSSTSNLLNNRPFGLHSGIHGYQPERCIIENNLIFNVGKGVFQKHPDANREDGYMVRNNIFYNNAEAAFSPQGNEAFPGTQHAGFHHNVVYNSGYGVWVVLQEPTEAGQDLKIYNNTIVNSKGITKLRAIQGVEIFNNLVSGSTTQFGGFSDIATEHDGLRAYAVSFIDNNLYFGGTYNWAVNLSSGGNDISFTSPAIWRISSALGMPLNPDANSIFDQDPQFVEANARNYSVQPGSPALQVGAGRGGLYPDYIGAVYQVDATSHQPEDETANPIGPVLGTHKQPAPIQGITIQ